MPVAVLGEAIEIVNVGARRGGRNKPTLLYLEGNRVVAGQKGKPLGADLLIIVARQSQRKLRDQRQYSAESVGAKPIGIDAGARREADGKCMFALRQRVGEHGAAP